MRLRGTFDRQEITKKNLHDIKEVIVSSSFSRPFFLLSTIALRLEPSWLVCTLNRIRTVDSDWLKKKKTKVHTHTHRFEIGFDFLLFFFYLFCLFFFFWKLRYLLSSVSVSCGAGKMAAPAKQKKQTKRQKKNNSTLNVFNLIPSSIDVECAWS